MEALDPVELHNGIWFKRCDLYRNPVYGVNGAKYRACQHLVRQARERGATRVVSAASVHSPQSAMAAVVAEENGMSCRVIVGGTTPEKAARHKSIALAEEAGAEVSSIPVGYNTALQSAARKLGEMPGNWTLPYGITTPPDASEQDIEDFLRVGSPQTANLPEGIETLVVPFGSGNTGAGVLYGLRDSRPSSLRRVVLMEIGPDRREWLKDRLGEPLVPGLDVSFTTLHGVWATYGDKMPETFEGIVFHPTYEGKIIRFLNTARPEWWTRRDGTTCFWIVGGPI